MTDSVPSSGDKGGIQPQVVQSNGIDNFMQSELRLNLKLSPVTIPNQKGEQQSGQTIHFTVENGTCQLILPRPLASDVLLNLKIPETLSLTVGQSSAPEPQTFTIQPPETLQRNLPLTDMLDIMKQSKQAIDKTNNLLQNCSDRFAKVEEEIANLKTALLSSIGLKTDDNRVSGNVIQEPTPIQNLLSVDVTDSQQFPIIIPVEKNVSLLKMEDAPLGQYSSVEQRKEVPLMVTVTTETEQGAEDHEEGIDTKQQDKVDLNTTEVEKSDASYHSSVKEESSTTVNLPIKIDGPEQHTIIAPKTEIFSKDSTTTSTKPGLLFPSKHHPLFSPFSGENEIEDKEETVLVPSSAVDLPEATFETDETAESLIRNDPQPPTTQDTSANPHGADIDDVSDFPAPFPKLVGTDKEELGKINVMIRKIVILLRDMEDNRKNRRRRPYDAEHLDNLYEYTRTDTFKKSSKRKEQLQEFLDKRVTLFKKTDPLYIFYQALLELFRWYDESCIIDLPCYLESKKDKKTNLKIFEQSILSELNAFVEKRFNDRINKYFEVQGRRYAGKPPQKGDEEIIDWRVIIEATKAYQYISDSPNYKKQELFHCAKKRHKENVWKSENEGYYNLFYSFLSKNSKNKPIINSDFAFFAKYPNVFTACEPIYFFSILKIWDRTNEE